MSSNATALLPAGLYAGDIPNLSIEQQAIIGFFSEITNEKTKVLYKQSLKVYFDWCAQQQIVVMDARPVHLRLYQSWLAQSAWAESTRSRLFGVVSVFYKRAVIDELILRDPTLGIKRPPVDKGKQRRTWLKPLDMRQFMDTAHAEGPQHFAMVNLLGAAGLRAAEACSLQIQHMTREAGVDIIRFVGKGGRAATMRLQPAVGEAVRAAIGDRQVGPVILNTEGNAYNPNSLWRMIKALAVKAGLDPADVSPHTMRRTCARSATLMGAPVIQTQALLRHANPGTTMLYIGDTGGMADLAAAQVSSFYSSLSSTG